MATDRHSLRLVIVSPDRSRDNDDFVLLEQEPWDPYVGFLTKLGVVAYLNKLLFQGPDLAENCGWDGDTLSRQIFGYPSRRDLNYTAGCSHGTLGPRRVQEVDYTEAIQCNLELEPELTYPALSVTRFAWVGDAYSPLGDVLARPAVTINANGIKIATKVYGTLLVTYKVCRHIYSIAIRPRVGATENKLQSFVYAVWSGGNTYLEVKPPAGAEDGECNYYRGSGNFTSEPNKPQSVPADDQNIYIDYCTQEETERPVIG
jgi:hypothetical protein